MCESTDKVIETTTTNQDCFTTSNNNNNSSSSTTTTSSNRTCFSFNIKTTTQKIDRQSPHRRYALKCILYPFRNDQRSISNTNHCSSSSSSLSSSVSYLISSILKIIFAIGIGSIIIMVTSYTLFQSNQPIGLYYRTIISSSKLFIHTSTTMTATHLRNFIQNNHHHNNNNIPSFRDFEFSKYFLSSFFERSTTTSNADTTAAESWTTSCTTVTKEKCNISQQRSSNDDNSSILYINDVDYNLLLNITYQVGNFYPLPPKEETTSTKTNDNNKKRYDTNIIMNQRIMMKPKRFIPVLEARGSDGRDIDKDEFGHRRDTMPIANAIDQYIIHNNGNNEGDHDVQSAIFQFLEEDNGSNQYAIQSNIALKKYLKEVAHGIIVRNNPGTLSPLSQKSFDDMLRQLSEDGVIILSHPDVMSTLGAKDSLVKIKHLKSGLTDTEVYYDEESFKEGFRRSIAFMPRVIKQNRGSQGEGVWIVKLKDENAYCDNYGDCIVSLDTELVLMEAFDNHVEYHTVGDFIEFCVNGRTEKSPGWTTTSNGKYFEGGLEAGAMVVDQRFLPRIVEGEVRCLMIGSELVEIVHKKPREGGLSATLQSGAIYTTYTADDPKFEKLVRNFKEDVPRIMESFGMSDQPLPLMWTVDYIYGDSDEDLYAGEINCSCPGITQQLHVTPIIAKYAIESVFNSR